MNIKDKLFGTTLKKCIIIFCIIFSIIAVGGTCSVNYLHDIATNNHIHVATIVVQDKVYGDNPNSDYYIIMDTNNQTYSIVDHGDGYGKIMFDSMEIGHSYEVVIKEPEMTDINQFVHIIQVHNDTSTN